MKTFSNFKIILGPVCLIILARRPLTPASVTAFPNNTLKAMNTTTARRKYQYIVKLEKVSDDDHTRNF